ncbi:hypothetical protein [Streptomyces sp. t39]|uniref:hypothetical protein n=1 Tax=Streptomyces sp. t39 TaxID=1828156 RepID=UPI0011CD7672|nr:hypothetical protein [Streptomyces sp. t39]TXS35200.1 hypothetical protein EAO77_37495 [Streptomyces sp. t39]
MTAATPASLPNPSEPPPPRPSCTLLANAFDAFYDFHRPLYLAHAHASLPPDEARIVVSLLFDLVASAWSTIVADRRPAARVWDLHTQALARRTRPTTPIEETVLLHEQLHLSIDHISTVTGRDPATITAHLAAGRRTQCRRSSRTGRSTTP